MPPLDSFDEELSTGIRTERCILSSLPPNTHAYPSIHLDEARVRSVVESLRAIQRFLADPGTHQQASSYEENNHAADVSRMSEIVFDHNPAFLMRLFAMFWQKFASPRPDSLNFAFASFVWAICHMDKQSTAATLALLYGKCKKRVISGKSLQRMFKHLYAYSFREQKSTADNGVELYALGLANEVVDYARGIADVNAVPLTCPNSHCTEAPCDQCLIPVSTFVRFVCKSQRAILWPVTMIQAHLRRCFFGEQFWSSLRDVRPCFADARQISHISTIECEDVTSKALSNTEAVNIFTVTRRLLQFHTMDQENLPPYGQVFLEA